MKNAGSISALADVVAAAIPVAGITGPVKTVADTGQIAGFVDKTVGRIAVAVEIDGVALFRHAGIPVEIIVRAVIVTKTRQIAHRAAGRRRLGVAGIDIRPFLDITIAVIIGAGRDFGPAKAGTAVSIRIIAVIALFALQSADDTVAAITIGAGARAGKIKAGVAFAAGDTANAIPAYVRVARAVKRTIVASFPRRGADRIAAK